MRFNQVKCRTRLNEIIIGSAVPKRYDGEQVIISVIRFFI